MILDNETWKYDSPYRRIEDEYRLKKELSKRREALPVIQDSGGIGYLVSPKSTNPKTGNIPQILVGRTKAEGHKSCEGCPMLSKKLGGKGEKTKCYHWGGSSQLGHIAMIKANAKDETKHREDLDYVLGSHEVSRYANYVRLAVGGDPSAFSRDKVIKMGETVKRHRFKGMLGYTHFSEGRGSHLKGLVMASCDDLESADKMVDKGWRVAAILPVMAPDIQPSKAGRFKGSKKWEGEKFSTPSGRNVTICPAQRGAEVTLPNGRKAPITCNECGMCDATQNKGGDIIGFFQH